MIEIIIIYSEIKEQYIGIDISNFVFLYFFQLINLQHGVSARTQIIKNFFLFTCIINNYFLYFLLFAQFEHSSNFNKIQLVYNTTDDGTIIKKINKNKITRKILKFKQKFKRTIEIDLT